MRRQVGQGPLIFHERQLARLRREISLRGLTERQAGPRRPRLLDFEQVRGEGILRRLLRPLRFEAPHLLAALVDGDVPPGLALGALAGDRPCALPNLRHGYFPPLAYSHSMRTPCRCARNSSAL